MARVQEWDADNTVVGSSVHRIPRFIGRGNGVFGEVEIHDVVACLDRNLINRG